MNHDPVTYCFECQRVRPKDDVEPLDAGSPRRACSQCRERINKARQAIKDAARRKAAA